jgi:hypothetical protein
MRIRHAFAVCVDTSIIRFSHHDLEERLSMSSPKTTNLEEEKTEKTRGNHDGNAVWRGASRHLSSVKPLRTLLDTAEMAWAKTDLSN